MLLNGIFYYDIALVYHLLPINRLAVQEPHSQCSLAENPKFLKNFRPKTNTLKGSFLLVFLINIYHFNSGFSIQK
jgi:hypothetical protein